jgi:long-chain fatty acid transport protein
MKHARMWYCVAMLLLVSSVFASNGTQIGTVGAKSTAMGSAFRGLADDWSAMFFNPAGLTQLGEWTVGLSVGTIMPRGSYTPAQYPMYPNAALYTDQRDLVKKNFVVPALGLFKRASKKMVLGIGVYAPFGLGTEFDLYKIPDGYNNPNLEENDLKTFSDHQVITVQPTVAYQVTDKLSVGAGFTFTWGKMTINQTMFPLNPIMGLLRTIAATPGHPLAALAPALTPNGSQTRFIVTNSLEGDGFAYGANLGVKYDILDNLSIGVSGRISTPLKMKGSAEGYYYFPYDAAKLGAMATYIAPLPDAAFGGAGNKQMLMASYSGQKITSIYDAEVKADLNLPWTIGGGIAYKPIPSLTITADASLTNWASWDSIQVKLSDGGSEQFLLEWKNTMEIGGGIEWKAWETDCMKLFLRGGFYTVDSPTPDKYMNPTMLDPTKRNVMTAGLGINCGKYKFDFAFEDVMFADKTVADYNMSTTTGHALNYAGLYKFNAKVFTVGLSVGM